VVRTLALDDAPVEQDALELDAHFGSSRRRAEGFDGAHQQRRLARDRWPDARVVDRDGSPIGFAFIKACGPTVPRGDGRRCQEAQTDCLQKRSATQLSGIVRSCTKTNRYASGITLSAEDAATLRERRVALLIDYPALLRAVRASDPDAVPRLADIVRRARTLGPVLVARAYGAWYDVDEASVAFSAGLDPVFVPPVGPGNVPTLSSLIVDGLSAIRAGQVQALALSGDDRLLPLVAAARGEDLPVALIAHSCQPDGPCLKLAEFAEPAAAFGRAVTRAERYRRGASVA
jgi:hypothetical protein